MKGARPWVLGLVLLSGPGLIAASPGDEPAARAEAPKKDDASVAPRKLIRPKTILMSANEVIARALPKLLEKPGDTAYRISVAGGLVGIGAYDARGGSDFGVNAPPLHIFPRAGAGNSLNIDPVTGRLR